MIAALNHKLLLSHEARDQLATDRSVLTDQNTKLLEHIERLNTKLAYKDQAHVVALAKAASISFEKGQSNVIDEIDNLWTSEEFAQELMYGNHFLCM